MTLTNISYIKQQVLWDQIIATWIEKQANNNSYLSLSIDSWQMALKASEAFNLIQTYQIPLHTIEKYFWHQEAKVFLEWVHSFRLICKEFNYNIDIATNIQDQENLTNTNKILNNKSNYFKIACQDFVQEINCAASFVSHQDITGNIGVVVLDLDQNYSQIDYIFSNFFNRSEYDIAFSPKLNSYSLINTAILILQIANCYITNQNINYEDFSRLLRTKYIKGAQSELHERSYMDYMLRKKIDYQFDWQYIKNHLLKLSQKNNDSINIFIELCEKITHQLTKQTNNNYPCSYWLEFIKKTLSTFGWCIENINTEEQNIINCWEEILNQYIDSANIIGCHSLATCINFLMKLIKLYNTNQNFVNTDHHGYPHKKITIMDLKTAMQVKFDYLWVCGVSEINWPCEHQFNPFIPISLQKEFGIPYGQSDKQNTIEIFNNYLQTLIHATKNTLICSYPLYLDDNLVNPSRLINTFPEFINTNLNFDQPSIAISPERYVDDNSPLYEQNIFSGTQIFKLQAACPFQANAKIRLQADSLNTPTTYLTKAIKGEILHKVLAKFWLKYNNSVSLQLLSINNIKQELLKITNKILYDLQKFKPTSLNSTILQLEATRITNLCFGFIEKYDLHRSDFSTLHVEQKFTVKLKDILINIKIDRIDQLANGDLLVIDYKTGKNASLSGLSANNFDSLDDPQLPIYSLYSAKIKALVLAVIRTDKLELLGVVENKLALSNLADVKYLNIPNWEEHTANWYESLYKLAMEFTNGVAIVNPKYGPATCRNCDLKYMCRVFTSHE